MQLSEIQNLRTMTQEMQNKRQELKELSKAAAALVEEQKAASINDALVLIYAMQGHEEIHSFKKWLELGYAVKKGEKALLLWGEPQKALKQEKQNEGEKDEFKFFPLAYVFSNKQVQPLKKYHA
jgi:hypothetical protein